MCIRDRLQDMGGRYKQSAFFAGGIQIIPDRFFYLLRRAEGHYRLRSNGSVEGYPVSIFSADLFKIHAFALNGIEHINSRLNEVRDERLYKTAGMVKNKDFRIDFCLLYTSRCV